MYSQFEEEVRKITHKTFEITCYMFPLDDKEIDEVSNSDSLPNKISSMVTFKGAARGALIISASLELYDAIAANMLGIDDTTTEEKDAALCEIANIICGNTVPLFARNGEICYINPPNIIQNAEESELMFKDYTNEELSVYLDEGYANISIFYK